MSQDDGRDGHNARFGPDGRFGPPGQFNGRGRDGEKFERGNGPGQLPPGQGRRGENQLPQPMPNGQNPATPGTPATPLPSPGATS